MDGLPQEGLAQPHTERDQWTPGGLSAGSPETQGMPRGVPFSEPPPGPPASLVETVEAEIIPRLLLAHRAGAPADAPAVAVARPPVAFDVADFTSLVLHRDFDAVCTQVEQWRVDGATLESLCFDLLSPVASRLGAMWERDECDFAQVTLGLWHVHQVLRDLSPAFPSAVDHAYRPVQVLVVAVPGEQHTLGATMVAEFFRRAGWNVNGGPLASIDALREIVRADAYDVIALSMCADSQVEVMRNCIRAIRRDSKNRSVGVMVGGPPFVLRPELVSLVGADALGASVPGALVTAERLAARSGWPGRD
jgi:methanogenic corrinoid protein MtbC1